MKRFILRVTLGVVLALPLALSAQAANDALNVDVTLHQDTLTAGYTVVNAAGTAWLGLPAKAIHGTKRLRVKLHQVVHPENYYGDEQPVSDLYRYNFYAQGDFKLKHAVWLKLSYPSNYADKQLVLKYYDSASDRWRKVSHQTDNSTAYTQRGALKKKHALIALFEKPADGQVVQGIASWYDWTGAACNSFPMGSRIRVTNVATGASVDSTIVSTGPFIPGRIVDLPRDEFAQIASLSAGVAEVTVTQIE